MTDDRLDACLRLVSDRHRRGVVQHLRNGATGETTVDDLAARLHNGGGLSGKGGRPERDQLALELTHNHLPMLADYGVVEYDVGSGTVRYRPDEQIEAVLDALPEEVAVESF